MSNSNNNLPAVSASEIAPRQQGTLYPEPFATRMAGRVKRTLGDIFGLRNFGVNLTTLAPGAQSSLRHRHSRQDEFIYILAGSPTLVDDAGAHLLKPGMCAGFPAEGRSHYLLNRSEGDVVYLEIGDRTADDEVFYPDDDIQVAVASDGKRRFEHKNGAPY
jgi:uncharacterized cupin superfamily protein